MSDLAFEQHETRLEDGRKLALWTLAPPAPATACLPVVIGSGFARRMHHFTKVALYGAYNGLFTCRYDPVNHVGLSEGRMWDFTLTDSLQSLRAAVDWTCGYTGRPQVAVVATSLTARVAFELAAQSERIALVITAVGVVNVRDTLKKAFGADYSAGPPEALPPYAVFEGKKIGHGFVRDAHARDWWSLERCARMVQKAKQPLVNFIGSDDTWIDPDDVHHAFGQEAGGPRKLLTLERAPHDLSRDAAVARTFLLRTIGELLAFGGRAQAPTDPPFEDGVKQALLERRIQRSSIDEPEGELNDEMGTVPDHRGDARGEPPRSHS
jgi:acyl transferase